MPFYKSFAIVGFGEMGSMLLEAFVKGEESHPRGYKFRVLTREGRQTNAKLDKYRSKGVDVIGVDYSSSESITLALEGVDVVFSTLRDDGLDLQTEVIHAAKAAGVKLFVPSEYGINTLGVKHEYLKVKTIAHDLLKELSLPYALFFVGIFPEMFFPNAIGPHMGVDFETGKFELFGDGNVPISWTSPRSIVTYVHHVFTTLPASELENRTFMIEGDRKTWREIVALWESKHKRKAQIHYRTEDEIRKFQTEQTSLLPVFISNSHRDGSAMNGGEDNIIWPEWNPLKWEDVMY